MNRYIVFACDYYEGNGGWGDAKFQTDDIAEVCRWAVKVKHQKGTPRSWTTVVTGDGRMQIFRTFGFGEYESYMASLEERILPDLSIERGYWTEAKPPRTWWQLKYESIVVLDTLAGRVGSVSLVDTEVRVEWEDVNLPGVPAPTTHRQ